MFARSRHGLGDLPEKGRAHENYNFPKIDPTFSDKRFTMTKPIIAVVPLADYERQSIWMHPGYLQGLLEAGAVPFILPFTDQGPDIYQLLSHADGLLVTGGQDVGPELYHAKKSPRCGECSQDRDFLDINCLKYAVDNDLPTLGICRGIQIMNAGGSGTLYQDLPTEHPSATEHSMKPPYDRIVHQNRVVPGTPLAKLVDGVSFGVNSYHHQAVKDLSVYLKAMAYSEDGLVEAAWNPGMNFMWLVQWHPELSFKTDALSQKIFSVFVAAAAQYRAS